MLRRLITYRVQLGECWLIRAARRRLVPSHLLYADDVLLFCQARSSNCQCLSVGRLGIHIWASTRQNPKFSKQVSRIAQIRLLRIMGIPCGTILFTYLGVPLFIGKPRRAYFQPVADRILGKLAKWKGSLFSMAGRICLIDSFVHSIWKSSVRFLVAIGDLFFFYFT